MSTKHRSAFEIAGFLNGSTKIQRENDTTEYFIKDRDIYFLDNRGIPTKTILSVGDFLERQWYPVSENKNTQYTHYYWQQWMVKEYGITELPKRITTELTWEEISKFLPGIVELDRTETKEVN